MAKKALIAKAQLLGQMKKVDACLRKWVCHYVNNLCSGTYLIESF